MKKSKIYKKALKLACEHLSDYEKKLYSDDTSHNEWQPDTWYEAMIARAKMVLEARKEEDEK